MDKCTDRSSGRRRFRRKPVTDERLRNWALAYLGRFASTEAHLVVVLVRKIKRHLGPDAVPDDLVRWAKAAEQVAGDMVRLGVVDDLGFATARARTLLRQGKSMRMIARTLTAKGVSDDHIEAALTALRRDSGGGEAAELEAAIALARRRRIGPFRRADKARDETARRREYGAMARGGFGYGLARRVVEATDEAELLDHLEDMRAGESAYDR